MSGFPCRDRRAQRDLSGQLARRGSGFVSEWMEIVIPVAVRDADDVAALIAEEVDAARAGTEIRNGEVILWARTAHLEHALSGTRRAVAQLARGGLAGDARSISVRPAAPQVEWRDSWKRHFHTARLTRQLVVVPSWENYLPKSDDLVLHLDPGQAFGTGLHISTRLVLDEIQQLSDRGTPVSRFLDLGTGSGILSIAAAMMWPHSRGYAIDVDPLAVAAVTENAAANGVGDRIACSLNQASHLTEAFDLVMANIQCDVLLDLCGVIASRAVPGGVIVLSGVLVSQVDSVTARYEDSGLFSVEEPRSASHFSAERPDVPATDAKPRSRRAVQPGRQDAEWSSIRLRRLEP